MADFPKSLCHAPFQPKPCKVKVILGTHTLWSNGYTKYPFDRHKEISISYVQRSRRGVVKDMCGSQKIIFTGVLYDERRPDVNQHTLPMPIER